MRRTVPCLLSVGFLLIGLQHSAEAQMWKKRPATMKRSTSLKATGKVRSRQLQTEFSRWNDFAAGGVQPDPPKPSDERRFDASQFNDEDLVSGTPTIPLPPSQELLEVMRMLDAIAEELDVEVDELLDDDMLFRDMKGLRELQRLMKDLEQGFKMPEMQDGLPGDWNPTVDGLQQGVMGAGTSIEDIIFGRQLPRWNGGMDVESFGSNKPGNGRYPSAETGPSGRAAPNIRPVEGSMDDLVVLDHGHDSDRDDLDRIVDAAISLLPGVRGFVVSVLSNFINPPTAGDFPDDATYDDGQPNPEGDDAGGPAGGQNEFLRWLAGRPPEAGNQALNQPITKWDVLGQPGPEGTRRRSSSPNRFSRMHYDINPALMRSAAGGGGSVRRPPIGPDRPVGPRGPDGPLGPGGPRPVK